MYGEGFYGGNGIVGAQVLKLNHVQYFPIFGMFANCSFHVWNARAKLFHYNTGEESDLIFH